MVAAEERRLNELKEKRAAAEAAAEAKLGDRESH